MRFKDVTFYNAKTITMQKCGLTLRDLKQIREEMRVTPGRSGNVTWDITINYGIKSLDGFVLPLGITKLKVDRRLEQSRNIGQVQRALADDGCEVEFVESCCGCSCSVL